MKRAIQLNYFSKKQVKELKIIIKGICQIQIN